MKTITIPLSFRRKKKKKKVYCKRCDWGNDDYHCTIWKTVNDHLSKNSRVKAHRFDKEKQNKNNDCKFYKFSFWWWMQ